MEDITKVEEQPATTERLACSPHSPHSPQESADTLVGRITSVFTASSNTASSRFAAHAAKFSSKAATCWNSCEPSS